MDTGGGLLLLTIIVFTAYHLFWGTVSWWQGYRALKSARRARVSRRFLEFQGRLFEAVKEGVIDYDDQFFQVFHQAADLFVQDEMDQTYLWAEFFDTLSSPTMASEETKQHVREIIDTIPRDDPEEEKRAIDVYRFLLDRRQELINDFEECVESVINEHFFLFRLLAWSKRMLGEGDPISKDVRNRRAKKLKANGKHKAGAPIAKAMVQAVQKMSRAVA